MTNNFLKNNRTFLIILSVITLIVIVGIIFAFKSKSKKTEIKEPEKEAVLPESAIIPTVDSSVIVDLKSFDKREVILSIKNIPKGTETVEYELSYLAKGDLQKGKIGTVEIKNEKEIERKITLGTCSSGTCVYDEGVEKIDVSLKFTGSYGEKIFKKEFSI